MEGRRVVDDEAVRSRARPGQSRSPRWSNATRTSTWGFTAAIGSRLRPDRGVRVAAPDAGEDVPRGVDVEPALAEVPREQVRNGERPVAALAADHDADVGELVGGPTLGRAGFGRDRNDACGR